MLTIINKYAMKKQQSTYKKNHTIVIIAIVVASILGVLVILELANVTNFFHRESIVKTTQANGPTKAEQEQQAKESASQKEQYLDTSKSTTNTDSSSSTSSSNTPTFTLSASQSGNIVTVLTKIQNVSGGTCKVVAVNDAKTTSQTAQIIYEPEFSSCAGFSINADTLGVGTWTITTTINPTGSDSLTKSISLEVR